MILAISVAALVTLPGNAVLEEVAVEAGPLEAAMAVVGEVGVEVGQELMKHAYGLI